IEGLPARPVRRHSFSGSTDIEQQKITAALSPRENMRRKVTLVDRVRGLLRGNSRRPQQQPQLPPQSVHSASRSQMPAMVEHAATIGTSAGAAALGVTAAAAGNWGPHNPFSHQSLMGLGRRASFDTLSIHEMAEADRHDMHSRLDHLLGSGSAGAPGSIAASPQLGHTAASSKFSFSALPSTPPQPKPLPATPRHPSQPQVFTFPAAQPRPIEPSPVFRSEASSQHHPLPVAPMQEMVEKSRPSNIQHFSQDSVHVNAAQVPDTQYPQQQQQLQQPQQQPLQPQQQLQQQPHYQQPLQQQTHYQQSVHDDGAPVVVKRPSLLKRLTAGWRKPVAQPGLQPIPEENHHMGTLGQVAAAEAGAGLLGRLFHPVAGPRPEAAMLSAPNVNVMQSPHAYPGAPHEISQVVSPRQQQDHSGSTIPAVVVSGPSPTVAPYDAANSGHQGQTPLPGQQPLQAGFPAQNIYAAFGPSVSSLAQP
ncbi:hypothetical protein GGI24_005976, partial [Coemansia furcata]